jgi:acylphosphatase
MNEVQKKEYSDLIEKLAARKNVAGWLKSVKDIELRIAELEALA